MAKSTKRGRPSTSVPSQTALELFTDGEQPQQKNANPGESLQQQGTYEWTPWQENAFDAFYR